MYSFRSKGKRNIKVRERAIAVILLSSTSFHFLDIKVFFLFGYTIDKRKMLSDYKYVAAFYSLIELFSKVTQKASKLILLYKIENEFLLWEFSAKSIYNHHHISVAEGFMERFTPERISNSWVPDGRALLMVRALITSMMVSFVDSNGILRMITNNDYQLLLLSMQGYFFSFKLYLNSR